MNKLNIKRRSQVVAAFVEGNSIRATCRMTGVAKGTVLKLLVDLGYSPAQCLGTRRVCIAGQPDPEHVSTSFVERQNLTMRMGMRRFTRLTNAFSKKVDNHKAAVALHYACYNFARIHQTLRVAPAMEAGVADHVWSLAEIVGLLETEGQSN